MKTTTFDPFDWIGGAGYILGVLLKDPEGRAVLDKVCLLQSAMDKSEQLRDWQAHVRAVLDAAGALEAAS